MGGGRFILVSSKSGEFILGGGWSWWVVVDGSGWWHGS